MIISKQTAEARRVKGNQSRNVTAQQDEKETKRRKRESIN